MAITTTVSIRSAANQYIPDSYVPTSLPALTDPQKVQESAQVLVSLTAGATEEITLGNITTQLLSYLTGTYYPNVLKLDALKTISVNIDVFKVEIVRSTNDLITGVENYDISFIASWE